MTQSGGHRPDAPQCPFVRPVYRIAHDAKLGLSPNASWISAGRVFYNFGSGISRLPVRRFPSKLLRSTRFVEEIALGPDQTSRLYPAIFVRVLRRRRCCLTRAVVVPFCGR